ncbi:MAG: stage II sporulation protein M [Archaeoglobaceae archaeon]
MPDDLSFKKIYPYFILFAILFFSSGASGYFYAQSHPEMASESFNTLSQQFEVIEEFHPLLIFLFIFFNNSIKALIATATGFFFGLSPIFFITFNGYIIGLVVYVGGANIGADQILMRLIPHGIFEVPAILLACSYGLWTGKQFYRRTIRKEDISIKSTLLKASYKCLRVVFPLLLVAAVVETFITPLIAGIV